MIPTALIVIWSALAHPIYTPRYLSFTAPAMALVLGVCIGALAVKPWVAAALVSLFAIAAAPNYVRAQRNPYAKYGMDYSQVADLITAQAAPGDCLLVNDTVTFMPAPMRPLLAARPDAYRKLVDLTLWQTGDRPQRRLRHQPHPRSRRQAAEPLRRGVDHHPSRQVDARPRAGRGAAARPASTGRPQPSRFRATWASGWSSAGSSTWFR